MTTPQNTPIADSTSDETGREAVGESRSPTGRESSLNQEVVVLAQRQLTSGFEVAEMNNQRVEAEIRQRRLEQELSQEARASIEEMRANFTVEDQGCIR